MFRALPAHPDLTHINKQVRHLLHDLRLRHATAVEQYYSLDSLADTYDPGLADAQYLIAREYGYASWPKLKEHLDRRLVEPSAEDVPSPS